MKEFKARNTIAVIDLKGDTLKAQIEDGYRLIGQYLINHAKEMSADVEPNISEIELKIKIPTDYVITMEKKTNFYIAKENYNE